MIGGQDESSDGPRLMVIVLNWNGLQDTKHCYDSILADGIPASSVTLVDNGSLDGSAEGLQQLSPHPRVIVNPSNLGFSGGMNSGLQNALNLGVDYICILNNDTVVQPGMFKELLRHAESGAAVSPEVRYRGAPDRIWFGGGVVDRSRSWPRHLTPGELDRLDEAQPGAAVRPSEILAGCCILARSTTWLKVGMFDESYFLLFEDADWSARATALGVPLLVARRATLLHAVSASFVGPGQFMASYYYARNGLRYGRSHCSGSPLSRLRFARDQVLRPGLRTFRDGPRMTASRKILFGIFGLLAGASHGHGRAPKALESLASRWGR